MDNPPDYQSPVTPLPPVEAPPTLSQPAPAVYPAPASAIYQVPTPPAPKETQTIELVALVAVILLFISIFFGISIISKVLLAGFAIFGIVYFVMDYFKNRKIVKSLTSQTFGQPGVYQAAYNPGIAVAPLPKAPQSTATKAIKVTVISLGIVLFTVFVFPVLAVLFLMIIFMSGGHGQSG